MEVRARTAVPTAPTITELTKNMDCTALWSGSTGVPDEKSIPDQSSIPDQKLDAAAAALEQVANVREDYQQRIEAAAPSEAGHS
jgi:hypothetical protein